MAKIKNKEAKKEKFNIKKWSLILAVLIIIGVAAFFIGNYVKTANVIKEQEKQMALESWLENNCKCLERKRITCMDGFVLNKMVCRNDALKLYSNVLKACSKYDCNGKNYNFNLQTEKWEN